MILLQQNNYLGDDEMAYQFYIQGTIPKGEMPSYTLQKAGHPEYFQLEDPILNAALNLLQLMDILDIDELLEEDCFDSIWLASELTPARAAEVYHYIHGDSSIQPLPTEDEIAAFKNARAAELALLCKRSPKTGQVPVHKFATADNWRVVPEECLLIVSALTDNLLEDNTIVVSEVAKLCEVNRQKLEAKLKEWREFNQFAARFGGYIVR